MLQKRKAVVKVEEDPNVKKTVQSTKDADNTEVKPNSKKSDVVDSFPFFYFVFMWWVGVLVIFNSKSQYYALHF